MRQPFRQAITAASLATLLGLGACARRQAAAPASPVGATRVVTTTATTTPTGPRRPAPEFVTVGPMQRAIPSKQFKGQPVIILVAPTADSGALRKEADRIEKLYLDLSARRTIFVSAFTATPGRVASDVPYILAQNGLGVANAFGVGGSEFAVIVIGVDGNVDMVSRQVESAQHILDVINNNGSVQAANRTGLGS